MMMHSNTRATDGPPQWLGYVLAIVGNIVVSLSLNTQRLAHKKLEEDSHDDHHNDEERQQPHDYNDRDHNNHEDDRDATTATDSQPQRNYLRSPYWWAGIVLMAAGETGNFLAYAFAPASVVATLGTTGLIANVIFAPLILQEHFRAKDFAGVALAAAGAVAVVLSSDQEQPQLNPDEIKQAIGQLSFRIYALVSIILIAGLMALSPKYGDRYILIDLGCVALFGAFTALSTKGTSSLLSALFYNVFSYPIFYALVAVLIITAVMQVRYLNRALARFDATQVIPTQFVTFTISTIVGSAVLYRDFQKMSAVNLFTFFLGCLLTFSGVYIISSGRETDEDESKNNTHDSPGHASSSDATSWTDKLKRAWNKTFTTGGPPTDERTRLLSAGRDSLDRSNHRQGRRRLPSTGADGRVPAVYLTAPSPQQTFDGSAGHMGGSSTAGTSLRRARLDRLSSSQSVNQSAPLLAYFVSRQHSATGSGIGHAAPSSHSVRSRASFSSSYRSGHHVPALDHHTARPVDRQAVVPEETRTEGSRDQAR
ncbi:hypothetical protein PYCC9005_002331 [Savitreella phatthalungensis]